MNRRRAAALQANSGEGAAADFARIVTQGLADSAVLFDKSGAVSYPVLPTVRPVDPVPDQPDWRAAQTLEATAVSEITKAATACFTRCLQCRALGLRHSDRAQPAARHGESSPSSPGFVIASHEMPTSREVEAT